jgi:hypothetical protein
MGPLPGPLGADSGTPTNGHQRERGCGLRDTWSSDAPQRSFGQYTSDEPKFSRPIPAYDWDSYRPPTKARPVSDAPRPSGMSGGGTPLPSPRQQRQVEQPQEPDPEQPGYQEPDGGGWGHTGPAGRPPFTRRI